jgi:DNA/RNA-binding domain of Phe-tRNA-synthetase-like protein
LPLGVTRLLCPVAKLAGARVGLAPRPVASLTVHPHPLLALRAFLTQFPAPLGELPAEAYTSLLSAQAEVPFQPSDTLKAAIRELLRHGGFKPTGRSKPASEYLVRAASEGQLRPINPAVDVGNVVALHSGFPVSVVDVDRLVPPLVVRLAPPGSRFVFNASGQEIDVENLVCLEDGGGPCANPVKDAQRTKTDASTTQTLTVVWGSTALGELVDEAVGWAWELLARVGATCESVNSVPPPP